MSATEHAFSSRMQGTVKDFNLGDDSATIETFSRDATFVVPGA